MSELAALLKLARHRKRNGASPLRVPDQTLTRFDLNPNHLPDDIKQEIETQLDRAPQVGYALASLVREITARQPATRAHAAAIVTLAHAMNVANRFRETLQLCDECAPLLQQIGVRDLLGMLYAEAGLAQTFISNGPAVEDWLVRANSVGRGALSPATRARLAWVEGEYLFGRSQYAKAHRRFHRAHNIYQQLGDKPNAMRTLCEMGHTLQRSAPREGLGMLRKARAYFVRTGRIIDAAYCNELIAQVDADINNIDKADAILSPVLAIFDKHQLHFSAGRALVDWSYQDWKAQRYGVMLKHAERACRELEMVGAGEELASAWINVGSALSKLNLYDQAAEYYSKAFTLADRQGHMAAAANAQANLGEVYAVKGENALALKAYERARALMAQIARWPLLIEADFDIARVYSHLNQPDQVLEALTHAERTAVQGKLPKPQARLDLNRAQVSFAKEDFAEAEQLLKHARAGLLRHKQKVEVAFCDRLLAEIPTAPPAQRLKRLARARAVFAKQNIIMEVAVCDLIRGEIYLEQRNAAAGIQEFTHAQHILRYFPVYDVRIEYGLARAHARTDARRALTHYVRAAQTVAQLRGAAGLEDLSDSLFQESERVIAEGLALATHLDAAEAALQLIQAAKAQLFVQALMPEHARSAAVSPRLDKLRQKEQSLRIRLNQQRQAMAWEAATAQSSPGARADSKSLNRLARLVREYERAAANLRIESGGGEGITFLPPFDLAHFRAAARARWGGAWCAVDYYITGEQLYIVTVDRRTVSLETQTWDTVDANMLKNAATDEPQRRRMVYERRVNGFRIPASGDPLGYLVKKLLPQAISKHSGSHLLISPHGLLHQIAFKALPLTEERHLLDDFIVSTIPNLQAFTQLVNAKRMSGADGTLLCGAAQFDPPVKPLPHAHAEVKAIQMMYPNAQVLWQDDNASDTLRAWNRDRRLAQFNVLHFATHASVDPDAPHHSNILLGKQSITVLDVIEWALNAELVTLSACSSSLGKKGGGDEWVSLARAFFVAGARALVASLWAVQDKSTTELMVLFYQNLKRGDAIAVALRNAQLEMKARGVSPYQWAAFTASGAV